MCLYLCLCDSMLSVHLTQESGVPEVLLHQAVLGTMVIHLIPMLCIYAKECLPGCILQSHRVCLKVTVQHCVRVCHMCVTVCLDPECGPDQGKQCGVEHHCSITVQRHVH